MFYYDFLKLYLDSPKLLSRPLAVDAPTPDACLYLLSCYLDNHSKRSFKWYVIAEEDYMYESAKPDQVEASFPVTVKGWCVLRSKQQEIGKKLLPRDIFKGRDLDTHSQDIKVLDDYSRDYGAAVYCNSSGQGLLANNQRYALLEVEPNPGIGADSFGLTYYSAE